MEHNYRISLKIGESSFEIESTDLKWLENKEKDYFEKLLAEVPKLVEPQKEMARVREPALPPELTINEFFQKYIKEKQIKSRTTIAVYFMYYLQKMTKNKTIKTADVTKCFSDVSYSNWNKLNVTDILRRAKRRALLNYVNNLWSLTITGEDYVFNSITGKEK